MDTAPPQRATPAREPEAEPALVVRFDSEQAFRDEFAENIGLGAMFVPTREPFRVRQNVAVKLSLAFCGADLTVPAEVVAIVAPDIAQLGSRTPGVSLRFTEPVAALRARAAALCGVDFGARAAPVEPQRRKRERSNTDVDIVIITAESEVAGRTANLSYSGVLALLPRVSLPIGAPVRVNLFNPLVELDLAVDGKIVHVRRCDGGVTAHGIQLHYPAERIDEVMAFVEFLQSFDRARRLATVSGELDDGGLGSVLEMFVNTAAAGTLVVSRGTETGKIVFSDNYILRCTLGMASGMKALARLFRWSKGHFEFHHDLQLTETPDDPQPFDAAMMMASVQLDEMARIGFDAFSASDAFQARAEGQPAHRDALTEVEREVLEHAVEGFTVEAISDMVAAPDADIFKALVVLLDVGLIERRG